MNIARMRGWIGFALLLCAWPTLSALAQEPALTSAATWQADSGDATTDARLADINLYAARYRAAFADELVRYYAAPRDLVETLLQDPLWTPADIYYACAIAHVLGRPCRYVAEQWRREHAEGWQGIARHLGIVPGSEPAKRLQQAFIPTYHRWGRPLPGSSQPTEAGKRK